MGESEPESRAPEAELRAESESESETESEAETESETETESESEAESESEFEAELRAPSSELQGRAPNSEAEWEPPWTLSDTISVLSTLAIRFSLGALSLLVILTVLLWVIPTASVAGSDGYAAACARAQEDRNLRHYLGSPISCDVVPRSYEVRPERESYAFAARGPLGYALVRAVRDPSGRIRVTPELFAGWRALWRRPLRGR